jgi:hemolysin III
MVAFLPLDRRLWRGERRMVAVSRTLTAGELSADKTVHIIGLVGGGVAAVVLLAVAAARSGPTGLVTAAAYAVCLIAMLSFSAAYNIAVDSRRREILCRFDHAGIFAMIAGTYTPFTVLGLRGAWAIGMTAVVWAIALVGIVLKLSVPAKRFHGFSTGLYLAFGWLGIVAFGPLAASIGMPLLILIGIGGLVYSVGTIFHLVEKMPYQKAVWHGFVLAAAAIHYAAVLGLVAGQG